MKKQRTRKRKILLGCLAALGVAFAAAVFAVILTIPPYPAFYKNVYLLEGIEKGVEDELPGICVPEASWLSLSNGKYQLKMDGRYKGAKPIQYEIRGTIQCNGVNVELSLSGRASDQEVVQDGWQYRGIGIEYTVTGKRIEYTSSGGCLEIETPEELADAEFNMGDYSYSLYTSFPVEALSEDEKEDVRNAVKARSLEIAYQMIDSFLNTSGSPTEEERLFLQERLRGYGYGDENFSVELLYNSRGWPVYLMGITEGGYVIYERDPRQFCECGEGKNPYNSYMECEKYYGGPMCYFVKPLEAEEMTAEATGEYFDILRKTYCDLVPTLDRQPRVESPEE